MNPSRRFAISAVLSGGLLSACLLLPATARAWGGAQHVYINRAAGENTPREMKGWRAFSRPMAFPGIYPDLWKGQDHRETPRHYFQPDRLPRGADMYALPRDKQTALDSLNLTREDLGVAPWIITDLLEQMSSAMKTNDWVWAARCGATIGHYVADLHMPLHCTKNFNGQETRQYGVHTRLEIDMTKAFFKKENMQVERGVYLDDPFHAVMTWIDESFKAAPVVLDADRTATRAAGGRTDTETYYLKFWDLTGDLIMSRISAAAGNIASLWYTAWVDAGRPEIPPPLDELPTESIFSGVGIDDPAKDVPSFSTQHQKAAYDMIVWIVMGAIALLVIGSSIYRHTQAKKAARSEEKAP